VALIPLAALQALEAARALGCPEATCRRVTQCLLEAAGAGGMVGGQGLDLLGEDRHLASAQLDELHAHKTGALLTAALVMGGLAAEASGPVLDALETYGRRIGLAFQIADDVLDATASTEALGKRPSDAELGKSTYVSLHGLDAARARGESEIAEALRALHRAGLDAPPLRALARYVVERRN
jgi:geranylgeranyl pyrophosphate synthase